MLGMRSHEATSAQMSLLLYKPAYPNLHCLLFPQSSGCALNHCYYHILPINFSVPSYHSTLYDFNTQHTAFVCPQDWTSSSRGSSTRDTTHSCSCRYGRWPACSSPSYCSLTSSKAPSKAFSTCLKTVSLGAILVSKK